MGETPGRIILLGSGETSPQGLALLRKVFQTVPVQQHIAILETPAGFQPNSAAVAQEIADAFRRALPEAISQIDIVPARSREGWEVSPDNPAVIDAMAHANCLFLGPGSPTYTVRHLSGTAALEALRRRWQQGSMVVFSSAALLAMGAYTLPVYEIYKVGDPLHWIEGVNLLADVLPGMALVGHWNNTDGGASLDTSCCYMGADRFARLLALLPPGAGVLTIDEHTGVVIDPGLRLAAVAGKGHAHVISRDGLQTLSRNCLYSLDGFVPVDHPTPAAYFAPRPKERLQTGAGPLPETVQHLVDRRALARQAGDYAAADAVRRELEQMGYLVQDTKAGAVVRPAQAAD